MSRQLTKLRHLRRQLEDICHPTPAAKWERRLKAQRVAGQPRSVTASERVAIFTAMFNDAQLPTGIRLAAYAKRQQVRASPAYRERVMLDQEQLRKHLKEFLRNDFRPARHRTTMTEFVTYIESQSAADGSATSLQDWQAARTPLWQEDYSKRGEEPVLTEAEALAESVLAEEFAKLVASMKQEAATEPGSSPAGELTPTSDGSATPQEG